MFATVRSQRGRVDVLVVNAGISEFSTLGTITPDHFDRVFVLNVRSLFFATQEAIVLMTDVGTVVTRGWTPEVRAFTEYLKEKDPETGRPYSTRYSGSLVSDFHRILLEGGVYYYPADTLSGKPQGKLRLLYESQPLAFLAEQAGGRASTGKERIIDIQVEALHQRSPLVIGSMSEVTLFERFVRGEGAP